MLSIKNLKSGYNKSEILNDISLDVKPGEIIAIIGPNGAGKSTLLKSIFNLCEIYSGKIFFNNKNITKFQSKNAFHFYHEAGVPFDVSKNLLVQFKPLSAPCSPLLLRHKISTFAQLASDGVAIFVLDFHFH